MGIATTDAVIRSARTIINQAKEHNSWMLSENEYELLLSYNEQVAQFGTPTQRASYLGYCSWVGILLMIKHPLAAP